MKNCKKHFLVALIVLFLGQFLYPKAAKSQVIEVGGSIGLSYYMGDINPKKPLNCSELGWGVLARYYSNTRWAFRIAYSNLQLNGDDLKSGYRPERGLSFNTKAHDFALMAEFNFLDYFTGSKRSRLSPYLFGGISIFSFNPKADDGTNLHDERTDVIYGYYNDSDTSLYEKKIDYNTMAISIPFGIGVKYSLSARLGLALEWRWDYTFTDWIDDCHGYYPRYPYKDDEGNDVVNIYLADPTGLSEDPGNPGHNNTLYKQRGNKEDNDWFGYLSLSIVYKFTLPQCNDCNAKVKHNQYSYY